ncbi:hypothetical protein [Streptomyces blastmyceticus]|uniref:hypothetical protein n=1 Tax=Streptomyces blastmyceticus TaxID=68180 RepID=UPI0031DA09ED
MAPRMVFRALAATVAVATLSLPLTQAAYAAAEPQHAASASARDDDNPFRWMELDGLKAEFRFMCPAGRCVGYWSLALTEDVAAKTYAGGKFFAYAPATGDFGFFLDTDIAARTVDHPEQVRLIDSDFIRSHPRVEVRYGNPEQPRKAKVVASATTLML